MRKLFVLALVVVILIIGLIAVAYAESSSGGATGIRGRAERLYDPYSRAKYFGANYTKPVFGYGSKDAPNSGKAKGNYGAKGVGGVRNKLYNAMISQGRNPARISHYDSGWKGSKNLDMIVDLKPVFSVERDGHVLYTKGFARINSQEYEQNARLPFSEIDISIVNSIPANKTEIMGAWLVDEDTGYQLHLGNFDVGLRGSGSFTYRVYQFFGPYDNLLITREPVYPTDPFPHEPILIGDLK